MRTLIGSGTLEQCPRHFELRACVLLGFWARSCEKQAAFRDFVILEGIISYFLSFLRVS
jgi:hypothetical protein